MPLKALNDLSRVLESIESTVPISRQFRINSIDSSSGNEDNNALSDILQFTNGNRTEALRILDLFKRETGERIIELEKAIELADGDQITAMVHGCAGSCASCNITGLAELFRKLEQAGKADQLNEASRLLLLIQDEFRKCQ